MSALSRWFSHHFPVPAAAPSAQPPLHYSGYDLASMLNCHVDWIKHLSRDLGDDNDGLPVSLANIGRDDLCELGRWLHSDIQLRFGHTPEYQDLLRQHAEFHRRAADICRCHNQGLNETARWGLDHDLAALSERVSAALTRFYQQYLVDQPD